MKTIGFIGIGVMGRAMAGRLLDAGYALRVYARTAEKADGLVASGAVRCGSTGECVRGSDAVITIVGFPGDVEEVYFGPGGVLESAAPGALLIDMTTTDPALSTRIYAAAKARGLSALDAPVSGGDVGAQNGTLSIMAGGDEEAFLRAQPLFSCMGKAVTHTGPAGTGQHTKMANQIAICGSIAGVCEALTYARANGLDPENMLACISGGAAGSWQMRNMAPRILRGDLAPGFFIRHQTKDLRLAKAGAAAAHVDLPVLNAVSDMYAALESEGRGTDGTQALIKWYEENATC